MDVAGLQFGHLTLDCHPSSYKYCKWVLFLWQSGKRLCVLQYRAPGVTAHREVLLLAKKTHYNATPSLALPPSALSAAFPPSAVIWKPSQTRPLWSAQHKAARTTSCTSFSPYCCVAPLRGRPSCPTPRLGINLGRCLFQIKSKHFCKNRNSRG